ncbi:MAG: hypothetical protein ACRDWT_06400 [Jatrophihabitantaceae bacterium]
MFTTSPTQQPWQEALSHQGRIEVGPETAINDVRNAWMTAESSALFASCTRLRDPAL